MLNGPEAGDASGPFACLTLLFKVIKSVSSLRLSRFGMTLAATGLVTTQTIKIDVVDVRESKVGTASNDVLKGGIGKDKLSGGAGRGSGGR